MLVRVSFYALLASTAIAFLIPARYKSTARLMPPDNQSNSSNLGAMVAAATSSFTEDGLQGVASDLLGLKSTSDIFVGVLGSNTVQDDLIHQFDLQNFYWDNRRCASGLGGAYRHHYRTQESDHRDFGYGSESAEGHRHMSGLR